MKAKSAAPASNAWADEPLALIPTPTFRTKSTDIWTDGASKMCNVHNAIFRGYNSIYLQARHISEYDKADFLGYCRTWTKFVLVHAKEEEGGLFPSVEALLGEEVFKHTHEEHDAFMPGLQELHDYLHSLKTPSDFSSARLLALMAAFEKPFESHFRSEIETIAALVSHPKSPKAGTPEAAAATKRFDKWGMDSIFAGGMTDGTMFFLFNLDRSYEDGIWRDWPDIPAVMRWLLTRTVGRRHAGWWRFASCDADGGRRELHALPGGD